jgi:hypothetical protein
MNLRIGAMIAAGAALLIALVLLGWIGGELHYRNCLSEVNLRHPVGYSPARGNPANPYSSGSGPATFSFYPNKQARDEALNACSRLP